MSRALCFLLRAPSLTRWLNWLIKPFDKAGLVKNTCGWYQGAPRGLGEKSCPGGARAEKSCGGDFPFLKENHLYDSLASLIRSHFAINQINLFKFRGGVKHDRPPEHLDNSDCGSFPWPDFVWLPQERCFCCKCSLNSHSQDFKKYFRDRYIWIWPKSTRIPFTDVGCSLWSLALPAFPDLFQVCHWSWPQER